MLTIGSRAVELFPSESPGAPLVALFGFEEGAASVWQAARTAASVDFSLAAIGGVSWDDDMTPWPAPPVAKGMAPCGGRADAWIEELTGTVLPALCERLPGKPSYLALAGYSLGGLFAVYAPYRTSMFARVASASGSMWYPGFLEYARTHAFARTPDCVYLSLGDKEANTRNPMMKPVEENTRKLAEWYQSQGVNNTFELNPGGHFREPEARMARGIAWMLKARYKPRET